MNQQVVNKKWGSCNLRLSLPVANIQFQGLSESQYRSLRDEYSGFIAHSSGDTCQRDVICHTYQLERALAVSFESLTSLGQYSPLKVRKSEGIDLTGINFKARLGLGNANLQTSLGVAEEDELPHANVIENFLRILSAHQALKQGGVILHSAGLVFDDKAYIFSGRSNAGKTTLTRKAHEIGAWVLSDDINLLLPEPAGYSAHAVPFTGEFGRTLQHEGGRKSYPVAGIVLLEQANELMTESVRPSSAVARLLTACPFVNYDMGESEVLFDVLTALVARVPVVKLFSRKSDKIEAIMDVVSEELKYA